MAKAAERQLLANKFIQDALAYAESARRLDKLCGTKPKTRFVLPMYFLLGHAIELTLKAYLLASGVSAATLRNRVGHDLEQAFQSAKNHGLSPANDRFPELVSSLAPDHLDHSFRYRQAKGSGFVSYPSVPEAADIIDDTATAIELYVRQKLLATGYRMK
jgi:hypothetical protein